MAEHFLKAKLTYDCPKKLEDMTYTEGHYFCGSCDRLLVDFTHMSNEQLQQTLMKLAGTKSCGAFRADQIELSLSQKIVRHFRNVAAITIALFAVKPMKSQTDTTIKDPGGVMTIVAPSTDTTYGVVSGTISNAKTGDSIERIWIYVLDRNGERVDYTYTDSDGWYEIDLRSFSLTDILSLLVTDRHFKDVELPLSHTANQTVNVQVKWDYFRPTRLRNLLHPNRKRKVLRPVSVGSF
jgi:hypothetical protein